MTDHDQGQDRTKKRAMGSIARGYPPIPNNPAPARAPKTPSGIFVPDPRRSGNSR
jgi:hypothetical protein